MNLYVVSIFLASAQLFIVQPMFAKRLLPILGGAPAVWTTCMLFYQVALLGGYFYAHMLGRLKSIKLQLIIHGIALIVPLVVLAIGPPVWAPPEADGAVQWLLQYLIVAIGAPFFVLSTNAPLVQKWFSLKYQNHDAKTYALYSASNAGSMLALIAYPFLIEPHLRLSEQYTLLQMSYVAFVFVMVAIMAGLFKTEPSVISLTPGNDALEREQKTGAKPLWRQRLEWTFLAFVPSSLLLSVTTFITNDIAPCPLLWVIPLALYLLTFIIAFAEKQIISQRWLNMLFSISLILLAVVFFWKLLALNFVFMFPLHLITFFLAALLCHTRLARIKPETGRLTEFYLCLSLGGALGGIFNTLIAPLIFKTLFEYPLGLVLSCAGLTDSSQASQKPNWRMGGLIICGCLGTIALMLALSTGWNGIWSDFRLIVVLAPVAFACSFLVRQKVIMAVYLAIIFLVGAKFWRPDFLFERRNVFGTLAVAEITDNHEAQRNYHFMIHGSIVHGAERMDQGNKPELMTYYHIDSPIGHIFSTFNERWKSADIAVLGLGAGALTGYEQPGQHWTFFEINPMVAEVASDPKLFTYLSCAQGHTSVKIGDGRQSLLGVKDASENLIVLDAFSSDSIPLHLLTREALKLYVSKLADGGLIVFHISNRAVDLTPVLRELAKDANLACLVEQTATNKELAANHKYASKWLVMAKKMSDIEPLRQRYHFIESPSEPVASLWTDDFSNVLETLHVQAFR